MDANIAASPPPEQVPSPAPSETSLQRAGRVANSVNLRAVRFTHISGNVLEPAQALESDLVAKFAYIRPKATRNGSHFDVNSTLTFSWMRNVDESPITIATVRATIVIGYDAKDDAAITDDDLAEFAVVNVPFNAWGYWREFLQSTLSRLALPPYTLPLFRVQTARDLMIEDTPVGGG